MSWWVARAERTITEAIPAPPDEVRDFYVDLRNIGLVHPLVVSVEALARNETRDGYTESYRVVDRIPLGPLSLKITYRARLRVPASGDVLTEADQSPGVRLRGRMSFEPTPGGTRLTERLHISAPRPLAAFTTREAVKAHITMLAGIRRHFAGA